MMYTKTFTKILVSFTPLLTVPTAYSGEKRPNVIFILIDDMGYYDLSCYGATEVETVHIDKLAGEGIRFTDFYAAAPISSPSRAGILTGRYPRRVNNHIWVRRPDTEYGLNPEELTLAELFKQNGYKTACIGKWHLGFKESFLPQQQGFDHYYGILHNLDSFETSHFDNSGGVPLLRNDQVVARPADPAQLTRLYTEEAARWIESCMKEPFFLYLPYTTLHQPLGVSAPFAGTSGWGVYGDAILELDHYIGLLMDKLEELDLSDDTIIVLMSDNGRGPGRNANQPIRGSKMTTLEGGLRVPCIAWSPGLGIQKGVTTSSMAHAMDWFPTLASLANIKIPDHIILDGRDISMLLKGKKDECPFSSDHSLNATIPLRRHWNPGKEWAEVIERSEYLNAFFYHGSIGELAAVRWENWKLHLNPEMVLYDLKTDPGERNPINNQVIKRKLRGMAALFQEEMRFDDTNQ